MASNTGSSGCKGRDSPPPLSNDKGKGKMVEGVPIRQRKRTQIITIQNPGFKVSAPANTIEIGASSRPCKKRNTPPQSVVPHGVTSMDSDSTIPETHPHMQRNVDPDAETQGPDELETESGEDYGDDDQEEIVAVLKGPLDPRKRYRLRSGRLLIWPTDGYDGFRPSKSGSSSISRVIIENYKQCWPMWGLIKRDPALKTMMWNAFKDKCAWNAEEYDDTLMESIFHKKASQRLRDLLAKTKRTNTRPVWMGEGIWDDLKKHWEKPEVQKISEINKKNRASDTGGSLHTGGSISTAEHKARMEFDLGKRVGLPDIHRALHFKKNGEPVDERARRLQEEYEKNLSQRRSQVGDPDTSSTGTQFEMEHDSWIDVTGGINKKGRIPGAGNLARAYKEFPSSSSRSSSTGRSYVKEQAIVNDLVRQLAEEKEKRTQMEERMNQKMDEMRRWMFEMLQGHGASTLLTPRPTPRPTSMPYLPRGQPSSDVPYPTGSQFHCSPPPDGWHYTTPPGSQYWYGPRPGEFPHFGPPRAPRHDPANSPMSFVDAQPHQAPYIPRLHEENPRPRSDVTASIGFMELLRRGDRQLHEEYLQDGQHYDH